MCENKSTLMKIMFWLMKFKSISHCHSKGTMLALLECKCVCETNPIDALQVQFSCGLCFSNWCEADTGEDVINQFKETLTSWMLKPSCITYTHNKFNALWSTKWMVEIISLGVMGSKCKLRNLFCKYKEVHYSIMY